MLDNKNDLVSYTESAMSSSNLSTVKSKNYALVKFEVICRTKEGQYVYVLGNTKELGCWQPENGLKMSTNKETYPLWSATEEIKCNLNTEIYYKYVIIDLKTNEIQWESNIPNRILKLEQKGLYEIKEEKGNKNREIIYYNSNTSNLNNNMIGTYSPIHDRNVSRSKDSAGNDIEIRGSVCPSEYDENNRLINSHITDILNYDQVLIDAMQKQILNIGLKTQIEINVKEDKFIILTTLLPFRIIKNTNKTNEKYNIIPKYEDEFYESLFNIRNENIYEIYWFGMIENYEDFYITKNENNIDEEYIDPDLIEFLRKEKIFIIKPTIEDYNNYWIYISHIIGRMFYENKIPIDDDYFMQYETYFDSYKKINELFAKEIINEAKLDMLIMINDINLALVPHFISTKNHFAKMGFYLNNIFPSLEVFKSLQYQEEILQSILLCNLICFHHIKTAMKFLDTIQRILDLYYEVKTGGKIIINYQGRSVNIHIMQIGIDTKKIDEYLNKIEFKENYELMKKKYKDPSNEKEKEKYIFFSLDGLLDANKIVSKLQAFDYYYDKSYLEKFRKKINENESMEKIIEVNEENGINENNEEIQTNTNEQNDTLITINSNSKIDDNNIIINKSNSNIQTNVSQNLQKETNNNSVEEKINKNIPKFLNMKKPKIKKVKSKSGMNLSRTPQDIQTQKLEKEINEIYEKKEPILIQIIKPSESKLMNLYDFSSNESEHIKNQMENNYKTIIKIAEDINNKYKKEIIKIVYLQNNHNFSLFDLYSLYAIGDCFYCLRKDYNFNLHLQTYVYISNYMNKTYNLIISYNSNLTPGIKGAKKVNDFNIILQKEILENIFKMHMHYKNDNIIYNSNINFIKDNQILNWCKIFFSKLKKVSFYENNSQKKIYGIGLGCALMRLNKNFSHLDRKIISDLYRESNQNLIIIDYNTILQSFEENNIYQKENIIYQLKLLASQEKNKVYIISENTKSDIEQNIKDIPELGLACEYGFFYKPPKKKEYDQLIHIDDWTWKQGIMPILNGFTERTEGSYIIQKESMISWAYEKCESDFGQFQANEMISHIKTLLFQNDYIVVENDNEKNVVNIRPKKINKGFFVAEILKKEYFIGEFPNFIWVIGDKDGGEYMFKYLNYLKNFENEITVNSITAVVNKRESSANYYLNDSSEIFEYIEYLNKIDKSEDNYSSKLSQDIYNENSDNLELEVLES